MRAVQPVVCWCLRSSIAILRVYTCDGLLLICSVLCCAVLSPSAASASAIPHSSLYRGACRSLACARIPVLSTVTQNTQTHTLDAASARQRPHIHSCIAPRLSSLFCSPVQQSASTLIAQIRSAFAARFPLLPRFGLQWLLITAGSNAAHRQFKCVETWHSERSDM